MDANGRASCKALEQELNQKWNRVSTLSFRECGCIDHHCSSESTRRSWVWNLVLQNLGRLPAIWLLHQHIWVNLDLVGFHESGCLLKIQMHWGISIE